jgi:hypothetical protein
MDTADLGAETTESSLNFIKSKSKLVHDLARLGKYWAQAVLFKEYVYGKSLIFELMATKAALNEESQKDPSICNAFKMFLEMISKIKEQDIVFEDYYKRSEIPNCILIQRPLLVDPSNPYNNLLDKKKENIEKLFDIFSKCAENTLHVLKRGSTDIQEIFFPQRLPSTERCQEDWPKPLFTTIDIIKIDRTKRITSFLKPKYGMTTNSELAYQQLYKNQPAFQAMVYSFAAFAYNLTKTNEKETNAEIKKSVKALMGTLGWKCTDFAEWIPVGANSNDIAYHSLTIPLNDDHILLIALATDHSGKWRVCAYKNFMEKTGVILRKIQ